MEFQEIMVSVVMLAYNHEQYIATAIESIISQKTSFRYELIIGEDCSTDATKDIIKKYYDKYPDIIKPVFREKNLGTTKNSYDLLMRCQGKYIASCEGDDFWCCETRLEDDVKFLEKHSEYIGINHLVKVVNETGEEILNPPKMFFDFDKEIFTLKDYEEWKMPGHSLALTYRNIYKNTDVDFTIIYKASKRVGDRTGLMIRTLYGETYCSKKIVGCYRFVESPNAENFMSHYKYKNLRDEDYLMAHRLEQWAYEEMGHKVDLSIVKKDRLVGAVVLYMKNPTDENRKVLKNIIKYSGKPVKYRYYVLKIMLLKKYYWNIKKEDKRISL